MCGRASLPSISGMQGVHCHCSVSVCDRGGLMISLKLLHGGRGQPHRGLARGGAWLCPGSGNMLMGTTAGRGNPPTSPATARLLSSHAQCSGRDQGETSNICCCCVRLGEVLVWRAIPALENYSQSTREPCREQAGCTGMDLSLSPRGHCLRLGPGKL